MTIDRKELLENLKKCLAGIDTGFLILDGADNFVFMDNKIHSYNDSLFVTVPFESELQGIIKASELFNFLNKIDTDEIKIVTKDNKWVIKSGKAVAEFALQENNISEYISKAEKDAGEWTELPEDFMDGMDYCKFSCNKSGLRGICVKDDIMMSTDDMRINHYVLNSELPSFWMDDPAAGELMKLKGLKNIRLTPSWIEFQTEDGVIFSCKRLLDEKYPLDKLKKIVESHKKEKDDLSNVLDDAFKKIIDRAATFSMDMEGYQAIGVKIDQKRLECFAERATGSFKEKLNWTTPFEKEFDPITLYFDKESVQYGLKRATAFYIKIIEGKEGKLKKRVVFYNEKYSHLVSTIS